MVQGNSITLNQPTVQMVWENIDFTGYLRTFHYFELNVCHLDSEMSSIDILIGLQKTVINRVLPRKYGFKFLSF